MSGAQTCLPCPPEPWVVLARVILDDDGVITEIDNCECRRIVISFGPYALRCHTEKPTVDHLDPNQATQGDQNVPLKIVGSNFKDGMRVDLGPGVTVDYHGAKLDTTKTPPEYTVKMNVAGDAREGEHKVSLVNPDCTTTTVAGKFRINLPAAAGPSVAANTKKKAPSPAARGAGRKRKNI